MQQSKKDFPSSLISLWQSLFQQDLKLARLQLQKIQIA